MISESTPIASRLSDKLTRPDYSVRGDRFNPSLPDSGGSVHPNPRGSGGMIRGNGGTLGGCVDFLRRRCHSSSPDPFVVVRLGFLTRCRVRKQEVGGKQWC